MRTSPDQSEVERAAGELVDLPSDCDRQHLMLAVLDDSREMNRNAKERTRNSSVDVSIGVASRTSRSLICACLRASSARSRPCRDRARIGIFVHRHSRVILRLPRAAMTASAIRSAHLHLVPGRSRRRGQLQGHHVGLISVLGGETKLLFSPVRESGLPQQLGPFDPGRGRAEPASKLSARARLGKAMVSEKIVHRSKDPAAEAEFCEDGPAPASHSIGWGIRARSRYSKFARRSNRVRPRPSVPGSKELLKPIPPPGRGANARAADPRHRSAAASNAPT